MDARNKLAVMDLKGIDERLPQDTNAATTIENFTTDRQTLGWDNRLGFEPYCSNLIGEDNWGPFRNLKQPTSVFYWPTHGGAKSYMLYEGDYQGFFTADRVKLRYVVGNDGTGIPSFETIDSNRTRPAQNELGSFFEPFGKELVIMNGTDQPILFNGDRTRTLGFRTKPNPPTVWSPLSSSGGAGTRIQDFNGTIAYNPIQSSPDKDTSFLEPVSQRLDLYYGLGTRTDEKPNQYRYKVSFIMENGSESPISPRSAPARWDTVEADGRLALWLENLPLGPEGTVARRIYRTKNLGDNPTAVGTDQSTEDEVYYFLDQINDNECTHYFDIAPDSQLGFLAPRDDHSVPFPAAAGNVAATFKNCLFINGGAGDGYSLYYSNPLKPDQFSALDFFQAGNQTGGEIKALKGYYNSLLVFRERAIDIVIGDPVNGFKYVPYIKEVGCRSRFGVVEVPNQGVMFLSDDGVYLLSGGFDGGSKLQIKKMTPNLPQLFERISRTNLPKACAAYSSFFNEVHFYFTIDGALENNIGLVYHIEKQDWTIRKDFPVKCITNDLDGNLIFGHQDGYAIFNRDQDVDNCGLYFISKCKNAGTRIINQGGEDIVIARADTGLTRKYHSATHDFGYGPQKKFIKYVYLYVKAAASQGYKITYYLDRATDNPYVIDSKDLYFQRPEQTAQPVYGGGAYSDPSALTLGSSKWPQTDLIQVRFPVAQKAASYFSFEVETTGTDLYSGDMVIVGYSLEFQTNNLKTRSGRTNAL